MFRVVSVPGLQLPSTGEVGDQGSAGAYSVTWQQDCGPRVTLSQVGELGVFVSQLST